MTRPTFNVLVVDDESSFRDGAKRKLAALEFDAEIVPLMAENAAEAEAHIRTHFVHLAFVDLVLSRQRNADAGEGLRVLRTLRELAPSCQVVIVSTPTRDRLDPLLNLISPASPTPRPTMVSKRTGDVEYGLLASPAIQAWLDERVVIDDLAIVMDALKVKEDRVPNWRDDRDARRDEVEFLLARVFGTITSPLLSLEPTALDVRPLDSGFSASTAVEVIPKLGTDEEGVAVLGNRTVVKIGPRDSIQDEERRFAEVVRFGLSIRNRVELLTSAYGDALGAVCYSFAGGGDGLVESLHAVLSAGDYERTERAFENLFKTDPSTKKWYAVAGEPVTPSKQIKARTDSGDGPVARAHDEILKWANLKSKSGVLSYFTDEEASLRLKLGKAELVLPSEAALTWGEFSDGVPSCLTHGDLHSGNIFVEGAERAWMIDYGNAGLGPRLSDIASLLGSVRLDTLDADAELEEIAQAAVAERRFWVSVANASEAADVAKVPAAHRSAWQTLSVTLLDHARSNFERPPLSSNEITFVALTHAMWLASLARSDQERVRSLAWVSGVWSAYLQSLKAQQS